MIKRQSYIYNWNVYIWKDGLYTETGPNQHCNDKSPMFLFLEVLNYFLVPLAQKIEHG